MHLSVGQFDYLKSFGFTGRVSAKTNVRCVNLAGSPISKNEIKDSRESKTILYARDACPTSMKRACRHMQDCKLTNLKLAD